MYSTRRRFMLAAALVPAMSITHAQPKAPVAEKDYREVKPAQPVDTGSKIEVREFRRYTELFTQFLVAGLVLLAMEFLVNGFVIRRIP